MNSLKKVKNSLKRVGMITLASALFTNFNSLGSQELEKNKPLRRLYSDIVDISAEGSEKFLKMWRCETYVDSLDIYHCECGDDALVLSENGIEPMDVTWDGRHEIYAVDEFKSENFKNLRETYRGNFFYILPPVGNKVIFIATKKPYEENLEDMVMARKSLGKTRDNRMEKIYSTFSNLNDIDGAVYDRENGRIVIFAETDKNSDLTPMNLDDFLNIIEIVKEKEDIEVLIEPLGIKGLYELPSTFDIVLELVGFGLSMGSSIASSINQPPPTSSDLIASLVLTGTSALIENLDTKHQIDQKAAEYRTFQQVYFVPARIGYTNLGEKLVKANFTFTGLTFGHDPFTHKTIKSGVGGYKTLSQLLKESKDVGERGSFGEIQIENQEPHLRIGNDVVYIEDAKMRIRANSPYSALSKFASHFAEHSDSFAIEKPVFNELLHTARMFSIAKWLVYGGYPGIDLQQPQCASFKAPGNLIITQIDAVRCKTKKHGEYKARQSAYLTSSISYTADNIYLPGENFYINGVPLDKFKGLLLDAKPYRDAVDWRFNVGDKTYMAIALPFSSLIL